MKRETAAAAAALMDWGSGAVAHAKQAHWCAHHLAFHHDHRDYHLAHHGDRFAAAAAEAPAHDEQERAQV